MPRFIDNQRAPEIPPFHLAQFKTVPEASGGVCCGQAHDQNGEIEGLGANFKFFFGSFSEVLIVQNMESFKKVGVNGKEIYKERIKVTVPLSQITHLFGIVFDVKLQSVSNFLFAAVSCLLFNHATLNYRGDGGKKSLFGAQSMLIFADILERTQHNIPFSCHTGYFNTRLLVACVVLKVVYSQIRTNLENLEKFQS